MDLGEVLQVVPGLQEAMRPPGVMLRREGTPLRVVAAEDSRCVGGRNTATLTQVDHRAVLRVDLRVDLQAALRVVTQFTQPAAVAVLREAAPATLVLLGDFSPKSTQQKHHFTMVAAVVDPLVVTWCSPAALRGAAAVGIPPTVFSAHV